MADEVDVVNAVANHGEWDGPWRLVAGRWTRYRTLYGITVAVFAHRSWKPTQREVTL